MIRFSSKSYLSTPDSMGCLNRVIMNIPLVWLTVESHLIHVYLFRHLLKEPEPSSETRVSIDAAICTLELHTNICLLVLQIPIAIKILQH